jgi:hypothetical protein
MIRLIGVVLGDSEQAAEALQQCKINAFAARGIIDAICAGIDAAGGSDTDHSFMARIVQTYTGDTVRGELIAKGLVDE